MYRPHLKKVILTWSLDEGLSEKLKVVGQGKLDDMSLAFIRIALEKRDAKRQGHQWVPSKELQDDPNPYLRIETTRALLRSRPDEGMAALRKIHVCPAGK